VEELGHEEVGDFVGDGGLGVLVFGIEGWGGRERT
jgi:hypothetical protein